MRSGRLRQELTDMEWKEYRQRMTRGWKQLHGLTSSREGGTKSSHATWYTLSHSHRTTTAVNREKNYLKREEERTISTCWFTPNTTTPRLGGEARPSVWVPRVLDPSTTCHLFFPILYLAGSWIRSRGVEIRTKHSSTGCKQHLNSPHSIHIMRKKQFIYQR